MAERRRTRQGRPCLLLAHFWIDRPVVHFCRWSVLLPLRRRARSLLKQRGDPDGGRGQGDSRLDRYPAHLGYDRGRQDLCAQRSLDHSGCGPEDYELDAHAEKRDASGKWVSEHILELQAFARFLEAAISGKYKKPTQSTGSPTEPVTQSDISWVYPNIISTTFTGWNSPLSPATSALSWLGSVDHSDTMVVCESALNAMKSRVCLPVLPGMFPVAERPQLT